MKVSFNGVLENVATFETSGEVTVGTVVMMGGNGTVKACTDKAVFCGVLLAEKDGLASVQLAGYAKVPYTGSVSVGYQALVAGADGAVKVDATAGMNRLVVDVDTTNSVCGIIL